MCRRTDACALRDAVSKEVIFIDKDITGQNVSNQLDPFSFDQKQRLEEIEKKMRVKSEVQTYDFRDS